MLRDVPVCVTGGAGFIGSHLVEGLISAGAQVTVLDDLSTGRADNLRAVQNRVRLVVGSILDDAARAQAIRGSAIVFHLAAYVSAPGSVREPEACFRLNCEGTLKILEECSRTRVRRVVFASSAAVYGDAEGGARSEHDLVDPCSMYALSKAEGEALLRLWSRCYGLETVSLRFFNVFGPRQVAGSAYSAAIAAFARNLLAKRPVAIYGDGLQTRDFVGVASVVQCLLRAGAWSGPACGSSFNVGLGKGTTVREVASIMARIVQQPDEPEFLPPRVGDVRHSCAEIAAAVKTLGYAPTETVADGLRRTLDWYRQQRDL